MTTKLLTEDSRVFVVNTTAAFENQTSEVYRVSIFFDGTNTLCKIEYDTEFSNLPIDSISGGTTLALNDLKCYNRQIGAIKACLNTIDAAKDEISLAFIKQYVKGDLRSFKKEFVAVIKANIVDETHNLITLFGKNELEESYKSGIRYGFESALNRNFQVESQIVLANGMSL